MLLVVVCYQARQDVPSGANGGYRVTKLVSKRCQKFVLAPIRILESPLQIAQLGNVGVGAEPSNDATVCITDGDCARKEPTVSTILAAQRERVFPGLSHLHTLLDTRQDAIEMRRVMHLLPSIAKHLLWRRAGIFIPAVVVPG